MHQITLIKFTILFLFILNFSAGIFFINEGLFHYDSVVLAQAVEDTYKTGVLHPQVRSRYGSVILNLIIYLPFFLLGQNADFAVRFSSILFHSVSIVVLFLFVKELFGDYRQALFSALLLSFTPFYFQPNTYGKEHGAGIFFLLLSFYLLVKGLNKKSLTLVASASAIMAITGTVKEATLAGIPLFFLLYLQPALYLHPLRIILPKGRLKLKSLLALILPFALIFVFLFLLFLKREIYRGLFVLDEGGSYFFGLFYNLDVAVRDLFLTVPALLFILFIFAMIKMISEKKYFLVFFFLLWFMFIFYFGNLGSYCARYLDIVIIPVYILAAYSLSYFFPRHKIATVTALVFCVLYMFFYMYPMLINRHFYNGEKRFALFVKENTPDNALIIALDDAPFLHYYAQRKTIDYPKYGRQALDEFIARVNKYLSNNIPVYFTTRPLIFVRYRILKQAIDENFSVKLIGKHLTEDFHRPEIRLNTRYKGLLELSPKNNL